MPSIDALVVSETFSKSDTFQQTDSQIVTKMWEAL